MVLEQQDPVGRKDHRDKPVQGDLVETKVLLGQLEQLEILEPLDIKDRKVHQGILAPPDRLEITGL